MKQSAKIIYLVVVLIFTNLSYGQAHYFQKYDGIPIIAHTNVLSDQITTNLSSLSRMKELGIYGFYAVDINPERYNIIKNAGLKIFPQQIWSPNSWITYYTEGKYAVWEAEGKRNGEYGNAQIDHTTLVELTQDGNAIITKDNAVSGDLFDGPYTYQHAYYNIITETPAINYYIEYYLRLVSNEDYQFLSAHLNDVVCTLRVVASNPDSLDQIFDVREPVILSIGDFIDFSNNQLHPSFKKFVYTYDLSSNNLRDVGNSLPIEEIAPPITYTTEFMRYKVEWSGLSYCKLSVDKIVVYDRRGNELFNQPEISKANIISLVNQYNDTSCVLGWFGLNEPGCIDNYLCFRKVNEIIHEAAPNLDLFTTFSGASTSRYTWRDVYKGINSPLIYPGYEFVKRSGLKYLSINLL